MRLVLYANPLSDLCYPVSEAVTIEIKQTQRNRIAEAVEIFIIGNFILKSPPRYRDSEGDIVIIDCDDSYLAAVCDILDNGRDSMVVYIHGSYKYDEFDEPSEQVEVESVISSPDPEIEEIERHSAISSTSMEEPFSLVKEDDKQSVQDEDPEFCKKILEMVRDEIHKEVQQQVDDRLRSLRSEIEQEIKSQSSAAEIPSQADSGIHPLNKRSIYSSADTKPSGYYDMENSAIQDKFVASDIDLSTAKSMTESDRSSAVPIRKIIIDMPESSPSIHSSFEEGVVGIDHVRYSLEDSEKQDLKKFEKEALTREEKCENYVSKLSSPPHFVCLHCIGQNEFMEEEEFLSHDRQHAIIRVPNGVTLESLGIDLMSRSGISLATNGTTIERNYSPVTQKLAMDATVEHEGDVSLMSAIDNKKGTFWKQWRLCNSGTTKWKNITLELVSHTQGLDPFFCSVSLPNSLNVGRTLDAMVWMIAPLDGKPYRAVWRLTLPRESPNSPRNFFGPPLLFQFGAPTSSDGEVICDEESMSIVSTLLDSDFDLVEKEPGTEETDA